MTRAGYLRIGVLLAFTAAGLGLALPMASAAAPSDGGVLAGTVTAVADESTYPTSTIVYTFSPLHLVGTIHGVTDTFTLTGLTFTTTQPYHCLCEPSGPVTGAFPLIGSLGSSASCVGTTATTADDTVLGTATAGVFIDVPLSCTDAVGTVAMDLAMFATGPPASVPLAVAGQFD